MNSLLKVSPTWYAEHESFSLVKKIKERDIFLPGDVIPDWKNEVFLFSHPEECYALLFVPVGNQKEVWSLSWAMTFPFAHQWNVSDYVVLFSIPHEIEKVVRVIHKRFPVIPFLPAFTEPRGDSGEGDTVVPMGTGRRYQKPFVHAITKRRNPWG